MLADEVTAFDVAAYLGVLALEPELFEALPAYHPSLDPDLCLDVFRVGVEPQVRLAEDGFRPQRRGDKHQPAVFGMSFFERELEQREFHFRHGVRVRVLYVVLADRVAAFGAVKHRVASLYQVALVPVLHELPRYELLVIGIARREAAAPVDAQAERRILVHHLGDEEIDYVPGVDEGLHGLLGLLLALCVVPDIAPVEVRLRLVARLYRRRYAENGRAGDVEGQRVEDVEALHAHVADVYVAFRDRAAVADVQAARDVGIRSGEEELALFVINLRLECLRFLPAFLPFVLDFPEIGHKKRPSRPAPVYNYYYLLFEILLK